MRTALLPLLLLALGTAARASSWDEPFVIKDEEHNFEIQTPPDSVDWDAIEPDKENTAVRGHFRSVFADTEPMSYADVIIMVSPLTSGLAKMKLDKVAAKWEGGMIGFLDNKREKKTSSGTLGQGDLKVESYTIDVQGDFLAGTHHVTWTMARNGEFMYHILVIRAYKAIGDEMLEEEIRQIRDSFKFFEIKKPKGSKEGKKAEPPRAPGAGSAPAEETVDPELIKEEEFKQTFWRFECIKPEGLMTIPQEEHTDAEKANNMKLKFERVQPGSRFMIRIYAQTDQAKKYTVQQLIDSRINNFKKIYEGKQTKEPEIDTKYEFPLSKNAIKLTLIGRRFTTEYTWWYIADCKNERQYQIEIYATGGNAQERWGDTIEKFLQNFKPYK